MVRYTLSQIQKLKNKRPITCLTAYTSNIAKIVDEHVDVILIGDSLGITIYGMKNTQSVTLDMMKIHGKAVVRSTKKAFTMIDMPFHTYQNKKQALRNVKSLLNFTKCQSVKLEIDKTKVDIVSFLVKNNIKVISHIGIIPQKYKDFSKIKFVGRTTKEKEEVLDLAYRLEDAGSSMLLLECIAGKIAEKITKKLQMKKWKVFQEKKIIY